MIKPKTSGHKPPKSQRIDLNKEELLDILDFYLQYKPLFEEPPTDVNNTTMDAARDFTSLLYEYQIMDLNFHKNLNKMREKYGKHSFSDLSKEKLDFYEIMTIFTFIFRADHHLGDGGGYEAGIVTDTYYHLLSRMGEIRGELLKK